MTAGDQSDHQPFQQRPLADDRRLRAVDQGCEIAPAAEDQRSSEAIRR